MKLETGASYIYRENSQRFVPLKYSVRGRDLGSTVAEAQERVADNVPLPPGYRMEWTGEFGALVEAQKRLALIVPLSLLLILMLLYSLFNSVRDSLLALVGHSVRRRRRHSRALRRRPEFQRLGRRSASSRCSASRRWMASCWCPTSAANMDEGMGSEEAIIGAGETRMRQVFMTGFSACIGLVPAAISTGIGSQVQQPLACVIVGGMLLSPICSLLVIPTLARILMPGARRSRSRRAVRRPRAPPRRCRRRRAGCSPAAENPASGGRRGVGGWSLPLPDEPWPVAPGPIPACGLHGK